MHPIIPTRSRPRTDRTARYALAALLLLFAGGSLTWGQDAEGERTGDETAPLELVEVLIDPSQPGPETLCQLTVRLRNRGPRPVSSLVFEVEIEGRSLPVYEKQVFMVLVPPAPAADSTMNSTFDLRLFNFWTSDSQRPAPTDGTLDVRVRLIEGQWVDVRTDDDGTEVWALDTPVPGLPLEATVTLPIAKN